MRWYGLAPIAGAFLLVLVACNSYVTTLQPVEDEILVKLVPNPLRPNDIPFPLTYKTLPAFFSPSKWNIRRGGCRTS